MRDGEPSTIRHARVLRRQLTAAEALLWSRLRRLPDIRIRRQHPVGPYVADFACIAARLIIEVDGSSHETVDARAHDMRRSRYLTAHGWQILRIPNREVFAHPDDVVAAIRERL